jgi:hypothetical protein
MKTFNFMIIVLGYAAGIFALVTLLVNFEFIWAVLTIVNIGLAIINTKSYIKKY